MEDAGINVDNLEASSSTLSSQLLPPMKELNLSTKWIDFSKCDEKNVVFYKQDMYDKGGAYLVCNSNFNIKKISNEMNDTDVRMNL